MKPLRTRLAEARNRLRVPAEVVDRDYLISWLLAGISESNYLGSKLVFKGGTALKKCYFGGDYRFSEDLDFTGLPGVPSGNALDEAVLGACRLATENMAEYGPVEILPTRYVEKEPHPGRQEAFKLSVRLPWYGSHQLSLMIEVTTDEPILWPQARKSLLHGFEERVEAAVLTYSLEEIVAEKLRAILQQKRRLDEGRWIRSRARDFYDLWRIFDEFATSLNFVEFNQRFGKKCAVRSVNFEGIDDFFDARLLEESRATWEQSLRHLVTDLPPFDTVSGALRISLQSLFGSQGQ